MARPANIYRLGVKELWGLRRDPAMVILIVYSFTLSVYASATAAPDSINRSAIAIIDEDRSTLSRRVGDAFYPPMFLPPVEIGPGEVDPGLDAGRFTFVLDIPPNFQRDVEAGKKPAAQLNVDATRMSQALTGSGYIQTILQGEVGTYLKRRRVPDDPKVELALRTRFNPNLTRSWFGSVMEIINSVTMLSIILTGAALIREREHGTLEHLLVMPVTAFEIMTSKVWAMGVVVLAATGMSLVLVVQGALKVPVQGSIPLFLAGAALHLFATTSMGIFLATLARSMPQFGMLILLVLLPMQMLSGGSTPRESMPEAVQAVMMAAPTTHFVELGQTILYRGGGWSSVWPQFAWLTVIGGVLFTISLIRFRYTVTRSN